MASCLDIARWSVHLDVQGPSQWGVMGAFPPEGDTGDENLGGPDQSHSEERVTMPPELRRTMSVAYLRTLAVEGVPDATPRQPSKCRPLPAGGATAVMPRALRRFTQGETSTATNR
jgi:hypothetical protein